MLNFIQPFDYDRNLVFGCFLETLVNVYVVVGGLTLPILVLNDFLQLIDKTVAVCLIYILKLILKENNTSHYYGNRKNCSVMYQG